jgi:cytochrome b561
MAVLVLNQVFVGWFMTPYDETREPLVGQLYFWHKSFGLLIFALVIARLATRLTTEIPELPTSLPPRDRRYAHLAHRALYTIMFLSPITGYILSSTYEYSDGVTFFGINVPELLPDNALAYEASDWAHVIFGYSLLAIIVLHVAGAIKHRYFDNNPDNDVLSRML